MSILRQANTILRRESQIQFFSICLFQLSLTWYSLRPNLHGILAPDTD
jgi:hypothetical protein